MPLRAARPLASALLASIPLAPCVAAGDRAPVAYTVVDGASIPEPLGGLAGDAARGAAVATDPERGNCLGCHGETAAPLPALAAGRGAGRLRLAVVNLAILDPGIADHAFYDVADLGEAPEALVGTTRLTAQAVEDVVAWLRAGAE